jgi:integrase/recombinase XerD
MIAAATLSPSFPIVVRDFFLRYLTAQKGVSPRTIDAYRDALRLLFGYAERELKRPPTDLSLQDLDAPLILSFLDSLQKDRGNSVRTRNARLAAIKSFLRYASSRDLTALPVLQRSLAVPTKRCDKPLLGFLSREEINALLAVCDRTTWSGERDYVLLSLAYNTGARVSELVGLTLGDVILAGTGSVRIVGKGRKLRQVPLWKNTAALLRRWIDRLPGNGSEPVFPNRWGEPLTRSGVDKRLRAIVKLASTRCPSLVGRRISAHTMRHSTAMHMLKAGVDVTSLALWLGHASPTTTHGYVEADLDMKEKALAKLEPLTGRSTRFRPGDRLLAFLEGLGGPSTVQLGPPRTATIMRR